MTSRYAPPPAGLPANPSRDYAELSRVIRAEGLLKRRYGYYAVRISLNILAFAGGWVGFVYLGNSWWQLFLAAFFAVLVIQLGAGNLCSVYWPKRIELTRMNSRMASSAAGLASLLVVLPVGAISGAVGFAAWYWKLPWLPPVASLVGLALAFVLYPYLLNRAVNYSYDHLEEIAASLGA